MTIRLLLICLACLCPAAGFADELSEPYVLQAKAFIKENPELSGHADEAGLVDMWQRIEGLKNLIALYAADPAVFERPGQDELRVHMIHRRIHQHQSLLRIVYDDPLAQALAGTIRLHAKVAAAFMDGKVPETIYLSVADHAVSDGRILAEQLESKISPNHKIIKKKKPVVW